MSQTAIEFVKSTMVGVARQQLVGWGYDEQKIDAFLDATLPQIVALVQENYTDQELEELMEFHRTPLGQKALDLAPKLSNGGMEIGMKHGHILNS